MDKGFLDAFVLGRKSRLTPMRYKFARRAGLTPENYPYNICQTSDILYDKIRSKGYGRGFGTGRGYGPVGIPFGLSQQIDAYEITATEGCMVGKLVIPFAKYKCRGGTRTNPIQWQETYDDSGKIVSKSIARTPSVGANVGSALAAVAFIGLAIGVLIKFTRG